MPTLSVFYGIVIQMFWREHPPPHFHALYGEYEVQIDLRDLCAAWYVAAPCDGVGPGMGRRAS